MKNFEVGLSGALAVWAGSILFSASFPGALLPAGVAQFLAYRLHFHGRWFLDSQIDERAVSRFKDWRSTAEGSAGSPQRGPAA